MLNWIMWNRIDYLYEMDLVLNNVQRLICHKIQPTNQQKSGENAEYPFIAIALWYTLARNGSIWLGPIYGSNRIVSLSNWVQMNDLC